jgi:biopolymer transport protein ExbD
VYRPNPRIAGLLLLLLAVSLYLGSTHWIETRQYILLYTPISLAERETTYSLHVQNDANYNLSFQVWPSEETPIRTTWTIHGANGFVESGSKEVHLQREVFIGNARLKRGDYTLAFKVLTDARELDGLHPLLYITADNETLYRASDRYDILANTSGCIAAVGVFLLLFSFRRESVENKDPKGTDIQPPDRVKRFPGHGRRLRITNFGYMAAVFFALTVVVMMFITGAFEYRSVGLWVSVARLGTVFDSTDTWSKPIIIRLEARKIAQGKQQAWDGKYYFSFTFENHFFINEQEVGQKELTHRLRELLVVRKDRTVYVQGSNEILFQDVAQVVDSAKAAYASRVVLITDKAAR